jgi:hypothetical protein
MFSMVNHFSWFSSASQQMALCRDTFLNVLANHWTSQVEELNSHPITRKFRSVADPINLQPKYITNKTSPNCSSCWKWSDPHTCLASPQKLILTRWSPQCLFCNLLGPSKRSHCRSSKETCCLLMYAPSFPFHQHCIMILFTYFQTSCNAQLASTSYLSQWLTEVKSNPISQYVL